MSVFKDYDLLVASGLFDAEHYRASNPDVQRSNIDPLLHYLEHGAAEGRSPLPGFDALWYLRQCEAYGERPQNPLIHYITIGAQRGMRLTPGAAPAAHAPAEAAAQEQLLFVDVPRIVQGHADAPVKGGLSIAGWAVAKGGVRSIEVAVDGAVAAIAHHGIRRPDVAAQFGDWEEAMQSGYSAHVPPKALKKGPHTITVRLHDHAGNSVTQQFRVEVEEVSDEAGPWALRRKMSHAETLYTLAQIERRGTPPRFTVLLEGEASAALPRTLAALARQTYPHWHLQCATPALAVAVRELCADALETLAARLVEPTPAAARNRSKGRAPAPAARDLWWLPVRGGDEWSCDALLALAQAASAEPQLRFIYGDDRRPLAEDAEAPTGDAVAVEAYFKPQWSPELLACSNYIGRAWAVHADGLSAAGIESVDALAALGDYARVLRLTRAAPEAIGHVASVLMQCGGPLESFADEQAALRAALTRDGAAPQLTAGRAPGTHRVQWPLPREPRVSIIIPTCAAKGLVQSCLESLRELTRYRNYEIVCIENIPSDRSDWKQWLRTQADRVVQTSEPFNWSRFNNLAAAEASGELLLFLNDDIEILDADWLHALVEYATQADIGVVGAQLLYPDRSVQHAGVMLDEEGRGRHAFRHLGEDESGYFGLALTPRNVISVTGACLMVRREVYEAVGRFDEAHSVINNDLDFCLRVRQIGLRNVYTPHARLVHHELVSRARLEERYDTRAFRERWQQLISDGDPYFNPHLSRDNEAFTIEREPLQRLHGGHPLYEAAAIRRILVVKLDHIGDCVTALPALRRLRHHFPQARISVLAGASTLSVWQLEPAVDEVIEFSFFNARSGLGKLDRTEAEFHALRAQLAPRFFDLALDLRKHPDTREVLRYTGAQWLAGYDHQGRFPWLDMALEWDEDVPLRSKRTHVADDLIALVDAVAAHGIVTRERLTMPAMPPAVQALAQRGLFARPLICLHPASGSAMRQWPLKSFAQLVTQLLAGQGHQLAIIGGPDERSFADQLLAELDAPLRRSAALFDLVGALKLGELPALLARAQLFVGNNSGPQHLAAALGVPTLGIHSAVVDANEWAPLGERGLAIRRCLSCSPCYIEKPADCPRMLACLTDIHPNSIYRQIMSMLDEPRPEPSAAQAPHAPLAERV